MLRRVGKLARLAGPAALLMGCAVLQGPPGPTTMDARFAALKTGGLPVSAPVIVRWNEAKIPFIEAETDADAAFAMGYVHAHLRLGMLAAARRLAQGRISESAGPFTVDIDAAVRAFDPGRMTETIYRDMPEHSRMWLDRFTDGINTYAARLGPGEWPHEFAALAIEWEPWKPTDSLLIGRASGIDINWGVLFTLLQIEDEDLRAKVYAELLGRSSVGAPSYGTGGPPFGGLGPLEALAELGRMAGKSGSNSVVVDGGRSASGSALIANDPHLGFMIPNAWLVAGLKSPSYDIVGMMVPGTPVFGFGRNRDLAWGGTNLRATTSEFVDVSNLPAADFQTRKHRIGVRLWLDRTIETRESPFGPVMSDLSLVPQTARSFAIRWVGHDHSDEITALLGAMRARNFAEFRSAMKDFALPPQAFLVAERTGSIAGMIATKVPRRGANEPPGLLSDPAIARERWKALWAGPDLPFVRNPAEGYIASANNRPTAEETRPYGGFFPTDERVRRLQQLLARNGRMEAADLMRLQMDSVSLLMRELLDRARTHLEAWTPRGPDEAEAIRLILDWDGDYAVDSRGAVVAEAFMVRFVPAAWKALGEEREGAIYGQLARGRAYLRDRLDGLDRGGWSAVLGPALARAAEIAAKGLTWGDIHKIDVGHAFQRVPVPLIANRYRLDSLAVPGSTQTIFKTSHDLTDEEHRAFFGAQSRHVSDMADPDANWFVLFGGQDGWIGSPAFADQVPLWRRGDLIQVPLRPESVAATFRTVTRLTAE